MKIPALTTQQMIEVDRLIIDEYGIQLIQMMENAGRNLAAFAIQMLGASQKTVLVFCGAGNNGGGGMVAARHLHNRGVDVHLVRVGKSPLKEIPAHQWQILEEMGMRNEPEFNLANANLIVDAMIGYGLVGDPRPEVATVIERINSSGLPVLSLDAPSGLDTSSGAPGKPCIQARSTLTLALPKVGLLNPAAQAVVGNLYLADISVPPELYKKINIDVPALFLESTILTITKNGEFYD